MARILLLNDERDLLDICQIILESVGHSAETQWHPATAQAKAKRMQPDLIVLDLVMPQVSGAEVLRQLGFRVVTVGNADRFDVAATTVLVRPGDEDVGHRLQEALAGTGAPVRLETVDDLPEDVDARVLVGRDFTDSLAARGAGG